MIKKCLLSGFQTTYVNEIVAQCDFLEILGCIYIDEKKAPPTLKLALNRNDLRAGKIVENNLELHYDTDIVEKTAPFLINALTLFDRYDVNHSINTAERLRIIYLNVAFWLEKIKHENIEIVLSREIPHFPHEYCLYIAARLSNTEMLMFDYVEHLKRTLCVKSIENRYIKVKKSNESTLEKSKELLALLRSSYDKVIDNSKVPTISKFQKKWSLLSWAKYIIRDFLSVAKHKFSRSPVSILLSTEQYRNKEKPFHFLVRYYFFLLRFKVFYYEIFYRKLTKDFNIDTYKDKKIIVFYGNYQPERTTNPDGGTYFDILNVLKLMQCTLPNNYKILYKEHPHTFSPPYKDLFRGVLFRSKEYYDEIVSLGIDLVPIDYNTYNLITKSDYSASINGTVLIESVVNKTPAIMFGNMWIESLPNIYKVKNAQELHSILTTERGSLEYDENQIIDVFATIYDESIEHLNLLVDFRSFNSVKDEITKLLHYVKDKIEK